jgi:hypothetical protein
MIIEWIKVKNKHGINKIQKAQHTHTYTLNIENVIHRIKYTHTLPNVNTYAKNESKIQNATIIKP